MSYQVTSEFLKKFGLNTLEDLPELPKYKMDENRQIVIDDILEKQEENKENESSENSEENGEEENKSDSD